MGSLDAYVVCGVYLCINTLCMRMFYVVSGVCAWRVCVRCGVCDVCAWMWVVRGVQCVCSVRVVYDVCAYGVCCVCGMCAVCVCCVFVVCAVLWVCVRVHVFACMCVACVA